MPDMVKIGFTDQLVDDRASKLFTTGVPLPFEINLRALTMRWEDVETLVHQQLARKRVTSRREFFYISPHEAIETIYTCIETLNGIRSWPTTTIHILGGTDRVILPTKANDLFVPLAYPAPFAKTRWEVIDLWQSHSDGDQLEIYADSGSRWVSGLSDGDLYGDEDPVPFLDRKCEAPNISLNGKERLTTGERLIWLRDDVSPGKCIFKIFEAKDDCQIVSRTRYPNMSLEDGVNILEFPTRSPSPIMATIVSGALKLKGPRHWAPRPADRPFIGNERADPSRWLRQLGPKRNGANETKNSQPKGTGKIEQMGLW